MPTGVGLQIILINGWKRASTMKISLICTPRRARWQGGCLAEGQGQEGGWLVDGWRVVDDDDYGQAVGNPKRKV
jgi:hypothetical protein